MFRGKKKILKKNLCAICSSLDVEWSGEVRSVTYSADGKSVTVVYRVTLYGTDAEVLHFTQIRQLLLLARDHLARRSNSC